MIGLSSRRVSPIDMSVLARWKIRPRLMGVPGVANVAIYGQRDRQLQVQVDPKKLRAKHVTLTQVIETAGNALWVSPLTFVEASTPGTGGFFESANQRLVRPAHLADHRPPQQLAAVPVQDSGKLAAGRRGQRDRGPPAADRRRGRDRASQPVPGHREVPRRGHPAGHQGRRGRDGGHGPGPEGHRHRHPGVPPGELHRGRAAERRLGRADRLRAADRVAARHVRLVAARP